MTRRTQLEQLHLSLSTAEKERMSAMAEARGLPTSTFARMIVAGAISRGGAQIEVLLAAGEKVVESHGGIQNRSGRNYSRDWQRVADQQYVHVSGEWSLVKTAAHGTSTGPVRRDQNNWWHLAHTSDPSIMKPLAFERREAMAVAARYIEKVEEFPTSHSA